MTSGPLEATPAATVGGRWTRLALAAVLSASAALRLLMCARGGQYFFGDEERYDRAVGLYLAVARGDWHGARAIIAMPEHALFTWVGALATALQNLAAHATPYGDWSHHPEYVGFTMWLGACALSLFSTLNILLVYRLARALRAGREEALWAALLMAASNTAFYYARHLLPYDCAISAALLALAVGLRSPVPWRAGACGALAACAYHLYNGYWYLVPVILAALWRAWREEPARARLAWSLGGGLVLGMGVPLAVGTLAGGAGYWATMQAFSRTVTQGLFAEGWSLPWAYLWESEGLLGAAVAACVAAALLREARAPAGLGVRIRTWLAVLGLGYGLLVLMSSGLGRFVVYGRSVKPLVPFLCLAGGWALARLLARRPWLRVAVAAAVIACGTAHLAPHLARVFPREVEIGVLRRWGNPKHSLSVSGSLYIPLAMPVARPDLVLVNAQLLYPVRGYIGFPPGRTLIRVDNPLAYRPFQYEGHTPRERRILRSGDISIRLIELSDPGSVPDDLPVSLRYQNAERPSGR